MWNKLSILLDTDIESLLYSYEEEKDWQGILILNPSISSKIIIYNKPLLSYLISQFLLVGITNITVIAKSVDFDFPEISLEFVEDISKVNYRFNKVFVIYGNSFLYGPNLTKHFKRAMSRNEGITVIASMKRRGDYMLNIDENRHAVLTKDFSMNQYYAEPFIFIPQIDKVDLNLDQKILLTNSNLNAETMVRGMVSFQVISYESAFNFAQFVKIIEETTGEQIGCIEEILIRRGIIKFEEICKYIDSDTKEYLNRIFL